MSPDPAADLARPRATAMAPVRTETGATDWDHIAARVATSWRLVAPRRLLEALA